MQVDGWGIRQINVYRRILITYQAKETKTLDNTNTQYSMVKNFKETLPERES